MVGFRNNGIAWIPLHSLPILTLPYSIDTAMVDSLKEERSKREEAEQGLLDLQGEIAKVQAECRSASAALAEAQARDHYLGQQSEHDDADAEYWRAQAQQAVSQRDS